MMKFIPFVLLLVTANLIADDTPRHFLYLGPEVTHLKRTREGGISQSGETLGVRGGYEYLKRYKFYWGVEGNYYSGTLKGHAGKDDKIKSHFSDWSLEGRFGYTFAQKCGWRISLTPYFGYGAGVERNNFINPSPLHIHTHLDYHYIPVGLIAYARLNGYWDVGLNFKAKFLFESRNEVSNDPEFDKTKMLVKESIHYRLEIPIIYKAYPQWYVGLVPFYEYRHFDRQPNFPFDFLETKLYMYGASIQLIYCL